MSREILERAYLPPWNKGQKSPSFEGDFFLKKMLFPIDLFFGACYIVSVMRELDKKIQKLEKEIMFGKWLAFDPIKDHRLKVRKFNIEKTKLIKEYNEQSSN